MVGLESARAGCRSRWLTNVHRPHRRAGAKGPPSRGRHLAGNCRHRDANRKGRALIAARPSHRVFLCSMPVAVSVAVKRYSGCPADSHSEQLERSGRVEEPSGQLFRTGSEGFTGQPLPDRGGNRWRSNQGNGLSAPKGEDCPLPGTGCLQLSGLAQAKAPGPSPQRGFPTRKGKFGGRWARANACGVQEKLPAGGQPTIPGELHETLNRCNSAHGPPGGWLDSPSRGRVRTGGSPHTRLAILLADRPPPTRICPCLELLSHSRNRGLTPASLASRDRRAQRHRRRPFRTQAEDGEPEPSGMQGRAGPS